MREPLLSPEMLRMGIIRHEFNTVEAAVEGIDQLVEIYCGASSIDPTVSIIEGPRGTVPGWLGLELSTAFTAAGEQLLAGSSQAEYQRVVDLIDSTCQRFVRAELLDDSLQMVHCNIALGTSPHQDPAPAPSTNGPKPL